MAYGGNAFRTVGWLERPKSIVSEWVLSGRCKGCCTDVPGNVTLLTGIV